MFIIKAIGVFLIVVSSALIGLLKSRSLQERRKKLGLLLDGTNIFLNYIQQGECELEIAIKNAFLKCNFLNLNGKKILCCDNDLKNDKALIEDFFRVLGNSTKMIECNRINQFKIKLKSRLNEAENDVAQKVKIYQILGICIGLTIGILLI